MTLAYFTLVAPKVLRMLLDTWKIFVAMTLDKNYEGWNFNSGNYLFTADTK